jgi:hypothetical protein
MHYLNLKKIYLIISFYLLISFSAQAENYPWRLNQALELPKRLSLSGTHRLRFENLDEQYRSGRDGGDQVFVLRTLLLAEVKLQSLTFAMELEDSRAYLADSDTPLSTSVVNPLELLQAYVDMTIDDLFVSGSKSTLRGGRLTMDVGSRRLVARNRYRNTLNAFTGMDWQWTGADDSRLRLFYTLPVQRRVSGSLLDNEPRFDKEREDVSFWGVYYSPGKLPWGDKGELYFFSLNEDDTSDLATANREIYTTGFRLYRSAAKNKFDYQFESIFQFGESRASTSATIDLDHFAHFQHFEVGYTFDTSWTPRLQLQYDYASGDDDIGDSDNNRFNTLFGARRFDFGPTSIYGPFARSNLNTPGIRLTLKPRNKVNVFIALRGFWLASDDDAWTTARINNTTGQSENYIGTQLETRLRWDIVPGNLRLEAGAAHIFAGDLMDKAGKTDATYIYTQASFSF